VLNQSARGAYGAWERGLEGTVAFSNHAACPITISRRYGPSRGPNAQAGTDSQIYPASPPDTDPGQQGPSV